MIIRENKVNSILMETFNENPRIVFDSKRFAALDEAVKSTIANNVVIRTLDRMNIIRKHKNFKLYQDSKGDYTKTKAYKDFRKTLDFLKNNKKPGTTKVVTALDNLDKMVKKYTPAYKKFYSSNAGRSAQFIYVSTVATLFEATVYAFKSYTESAKTPSGSRVVKVSDSPNNIDNKKIIKTVFSILELDRKGDYKKAMDGIMTMAVKSEAVGATITIVLAAITAAVVTLRFTIFYVYQSRNRIAEYLRDTATIIDENAATLSNKNVASKQRDSADKFRMWADRIEVNASSATNKAEREVSSIDAQAGQDGMRNPQDSTSFGSNDNPSGSISDMMI